VIKEVDTKGMSKRQSFEALEDNETLWVSAFTFSFVLVANDA